MVLQKDFVQFNFIQKIFFGKLCHLLHNGSTTFFPYFCFSCIFASDRPLTFSMYVFTGIISILYCCARPLSLWKYNTQIHHLPTKQNMSSLITKEIFSNKV